MKYTNISKDELILLAEDSFKKKNYSKCTAVCSELLKQKAPSVVVYMHSICTLYNARKNDEYLDRQVDNTLLVITALDKFYTNSVVKNEKINLYVLDILQTLLLLNVDCAIYTFKSKKQLRSKKRLENSLLLSKQNLTTLEEFNFDTFELTFPRSIIELRDLAVDQILEFIDLSICGSWQAVDEYKLKLTDTYERIANFGNELKTIGIEGILQKQQEQIEYEIRKKEQEEYESQQVISSDDQGDDVDDYYIYDSLKEKNKKNIIDKKENDIDVNNAFDNEEQDFDDPLVSLKQDLEIFEDLKQESQAPTTDEFESDLDHTKSEIAELEHELSDIQAMLDQEAAELKAIEQDIDSETADDMTFTTDDITHATEDMAIVTEDINFAEDETSGDSIIEEAVFEIDDSDFDFDVDVSVSDGLSQEQKDAIKKKKALMVDIAIVVVSTVITLLILTLIMMQFKPDFIDWLIKTLFN